MRLPFKYGFLLVLLGLSCQHPAPLSQAEEKWRVDLQKLELRLDSLDSDYERTSELRRYVGRMADVGIAGVGEDSPYGEISWEGADLAEWNAIFKEDSIPANCGIISLFYARLLQHFGYRAYTYSCGWEDSPLVHTFTLVELPDEGKTIVQDATFNSTFLEKENLPYDFFKLLKKIKHGEYSNITALEDTVFTKNLLLPDTSFYTPVLKPRCKEDLLEMMRGDFSQVQPFTRSVNSMLRNPCLHQTFEERIIERLEADGKPPHILHFYTQQVYGMYGGEDLEGIQAKIKALED